MMSSEQGAQKRPHNPVDSICKKIKSIQKMDQVSNPALPILKFQSQNFDSPQWNTKKNLEEILKGRTFRSPDNISPILKSPDSESVVSEDTSPFQGSISGSHCANSTFTVTRSHERCSRSWLQGCPMESCSPHCFGSQEANAQNKQCALPNVESRDVCHKQKYVTSTPDLHFFTSEKKPDCTAIQPPVPEMFPSNERGEGQSLESKCDITYDVSLISEEDLLTTIFWACDTERTGKVAVSQVVDYLRHTTSRGSEDSGLEELCKMLDPEQQDVSIDLETYHAVMGQWIEDCKRRREDDALEESSAGMDTLESQATENISGAKQAHVQMNVTSGSLEASGGDVSKGDLEICDLLSCVADLQYNNQKLQEENSKLKLTLEAADETNNKLLADNEHLHQQIKSIQPSVLKAKSLEEELEDARTSLSLLEEKREQVAWQNKQLEKENQSLNIKVTSLQEENMKNCVDTEGLQKKILELSKSAAELEVQVHLYESTVENQEATLIKKEQDIKELKLSIVECSSIIETLRAEKNQLLENMRHMQQELISKGLCFPLLCKYNSNVPEGVNSLCCELELAQSSETILGAPSFPSDASCAAQLRIIKTEWTSLDDKLDHEVLLLLQGPECGREKFKTIIQNLEEEASEVEEFVITSLQGVENPDEDMQQAWERKLVVVKQELREKRHVWTQKLQILEKCRETLDKNFVQMAGNLRRARTEQFHLRKELSARQHEIEAVKQLQEESAGRAEALALELQEAKQQLEDASRHAGDQVEVFHSASEEAASLKSKLEEAISEQQKLRDGNAALTSTCQLLQEEVEHQKTTANALRRELLQSLCELLCQCCAELESDHGLLPTPAEPVKGKQLHYSKRLWSGRPSDILSWCSSPLLDALTLETSYPNNPPRHSWQSSGSCTFGRGELGPVPVSDVISEECRWKIRSAGAYTDADLPVSITMMDSSLTELDRAESTLPASLIPASDCFPSAQEALPSSVASTAPVTGCLVMEEKTPKGLREKEEDVPTSAAAEPSSDKDPAAPVPGPIKKEFCPVMEEHKPAFQNVLKQDPEVDQEKKNNKEQSEETPAVVPSRKGSSPTACGIKGDKAKQNELESASEKEVEAEFLRLSLGFKCDLFTLDKRVRLEERSRDLAEENLKKEITNAVKMLEALVPLFEEDNQAQEIIKKLQKSLQFLSQYAARVASRAEMLGAINQESRVSKAVEVMIQHVENLKRTYAKEHAELKELKQVLLQNERSFSSLGDRDESTNKKLPSPFNFKPSAALRRVSIATVPRSAGNAGMGLPLAQVHDPDGEERSERLNRRSSSWGKLGAKQNEKRPSLQRFLSTYSWAEYDEEHFAARKEQSELPAEVQEQPARKQSVSEKGKYPSKWTLESMYNFVSSWASHFKASFSNTNKTLWVSLSILVLLAAFTGFLIGLSLQRPVAAEPVGPGDSWTSLQQLLWPYTGLRHNAPPPV